MNHTPTPAEAVYTQDLEAEVDEFERKDFAKRIAKTVLDQPLSHSSLVVSIVGPWGSGKSTVLKYIGAEISSRTKAEGTALIAAFNPWRYAGEDALLYHLFEELVKAIDPELSILTTWQQMKRAAAKWAKPIKAGTQVAAWASNTKAPGSGAALSTAASALPEEFKLRMEEIREQVRGHLQGSDKRIVMPIDDVDRLDPNEILLLFRALKLIADLPNTTFIIAMDEEHVSQVIGKHIDGNPETGRRYIEKIVNVRLTLPTIPDHILEEYALNRFSSVWRKERGSIPKEDGERTTQIFQGLHAPFITTPRKVKSIENAFAFALGLLPDEVNAGDVLLLEATRLLHPALYLALPKFIPTLGRIADGDSLYMSEDIADAENEKKGEVLKRLLDPFSHLLSDQREVIARSFTSWFPQFHEYHSDADQARRTKRICSMDYFWRYFSGAVHKNDVHDARVAAWITLIKQGTENAVEEVRNHFEKPYARAFLKKVRMQCPPESQDCFSILIALSKVAPMYLDDSEESMLRSLGGEVASMISQHFKGETNYDKRMDFGIAVLQASNDIRWSFTVSDHIPNELLRRDSSKELTYETFRKSPFDQMLAQQSLEAYEDGLRPTDSEMIGNMVWAISRNHQIQDIKTRVGNLINTRPEIGSQFLVAGCGHGNGGDTREACWTWNGEEGLNKLERLLSLKAIKQIAKKRAAKPRGEKSRQKREYLTLEEVSWACLESIREREAAKKAKTKNAAANEGE